jgi:hypothetical protein
METQAHRREIDGDLYEVRPVDARTASDLLQRLIASIGNASGSLEDQIAGALRGGVKISEIADVLGKESTCNGKQLLRAQWPMHFRGKFMAMVEWVAFLLEVNYAGFTDGFPKLMERYAPEEAEKPSDA